MRLFSDGSFYLSHSSSLAAEYLCDRDTIQQHRNTGVLLSTVCQMHTMHRNTRLYPPDITVYTTCEDVCDWLHASMHNVAWMLDYYIHLDAKCAAMFKTERGTWEFKRELYQYITAFSDRELDDSWLPLLPNSARRIYASNVKRHQYRKVRLPFWIDGTVARPAAPAASVQSATNTDLPSYLLPELDLSDL